ncbi:uncharacterized protein DFE_1567 [Desulfovibrio ferrophilus]|uniref:Uncharacterized protein n=1 Tax=Desulfovibrio ferrophilus TaxID=241368 RepID=A0A2Z6AYN0_9BACT|nr:uncharacterized protein DFE_1567 [Desulfovibrio ferrophilus]
MGGHSGFTRGIGIGVVAFIQFQPEHGQQLRVRGCVAHAKQFPSEGVEIGLGPGAGKNAGWGQQEKKHECRKADA